MSHPTHPHWLVTHRRRTFGDRLRGLLEWSAGGSRPGRSTEPPVVLCYDLREGESLASWCRRHPTLAPPADAERVVWVLPERPLPPPIQPVERTTE